MFSHHVDQELSLLEIRKCYKLTEGKWSKGHNTNWCFGFWTRLSHYLTKSMFTYVMMIRGVFPLGPGSVCLDGHCVYIKIGQTCLHCFRHSCILSARWLFHCIVSQGILRYRYCSVSWWLHLKCPNARENSIAKDVQLFPGLKCPYLSYAIDLFETQNGIKISYMYFKYFQNLKKNKKLVKAICICYFWIFKIVMWKWQIKTDEAN